MDVGIAPRALQEAFSHQHVVLPDDGAVLDRLFRYLETTRPTMAEIKYAVCEFYHLDVTEIEGRSRQPFVVLARHVFCYLARKYSRATFNQIRRRCGYRNHTSVWHAVRRVQQYAMTRPLVRDDLDLLRLRIAEKILLRPSVGRA